MPRVCVLVLLCLLAARGFTLPALAGPTGLTVLPDAQRSAPGGELALGLADGPGRQGLHARLVYDVVFAELGALYTRDDVDVSGVNAKLTRVLPGGRARAALGGLLLHTRLVDTTAAYLATTRDMRWGEVTGGITWTRVAGVGASAALRPYAGVRVMLPDEVQLVAEYQAKGAGLYEAHPLTAVMLVRARGLLTTTVGMTNAVGLLGADAAHVFAGITTPFPLGRP